MPNKQNPKKLSRVIRTNGHIYKQLKRSDRYAIYVQSKTLKSEPIGYEIIKIEIRGSRKIKGRYVPTKEVYPRESKWGISGWTRRTKESALAKYKSLVERDKEGELLVKSLLKELLV